MSRYIDADKMLKEYQETLCFNVLCSLCPFLDNIKDDTCQVEKWINEQPTADVRPNVKGEWKMINEQLAKCSVCGGYESTNGKDKTMTGVIFKTQKKYCPHCGARMVEE